MAPRNGGDIHHALVPRPFQAHVGGDPVGNATLGAVSEQVAGFDIGGTKTLALVVSGKEVVARRKVPRPHGGEETVSQLHDLVEQLEIDTGASIDAVGVGIAGAIGDGWVKYSPNIPEIVDFPLQDKLAANLDRPVVVDNDATTATWAELHMGAGRDVADMAYVALGTGIGTGFVLNGQLLRGANGFAGESGHMVVNSDGEKHITNVRGPWEMRASGSGLGALAREFASRGEASTIVGLAGSIAAIRGEHVSQALTAGTEPGTAEALAILDDFAVDVAVGMVNLVYILDPERIVLGGGLVNLGEPLRQRVDAQVNRTIIGGEFRPQVPVVLAELGSDAGALGAALLAADALSALR